MAATAKKTQKASKTKTPKLELATGEMPKQLQMDAVHLKTFLYLEQKLKNVTLSRQVAATDWEKAARDHSLKLSKLQAEEEETKNEYTGLLKELEEKFGVSMKDYAYDDKTGTLNFIKG